jgi:hypothetical protein
MNLRDRKDDFMGIQHPWTRLAKRITRSPTANNATDEDRLYDYLFILLNSLQFSYKYKFILSITIADRIYWIEFKVLWIAIKQGRRKNSVRILHRNPLQRYARIINNEWSFHYFTACGKQNVTKSRKCQDWHSVKNPVMQFVPTKLSYQLEITHLRLYNGCVSCRDTKRETSY